MLWSIPLVLIAGYAAIVLGMALMETRLIFPAPSLPPEELARAAAAEGAEEITLTAEDGTRLYGWRYMRGQGRLALLFGGNGSTVSNYGPRHQRFLAEGFDVLQVNYRGYPGSEGTPSSEGLGQDALAAWRLAREQFAPEQILVYGKSMGGGVALGLVAALPPEEQPAALIIESSFTSVADVAARSYPWLPVRWILRNRFPSLERARGFTGPALVVHSTADEVIPYDMGQALAEAFPHGKLVSVQGPEHNVDLTADPTAWAALLALAPGAP
ncbi:MAG: alpha/beta hydrolase [Alphaproteobacteria bacterium]|nr:alpha/beta hydrolase [Alphaproteobacteria bacterium]MCB9796775.1 alpha/beta hydrolase [Alphaproteobacteria bacterium]